MGFFARPRLSNDQFVQHKDDVLTLSGQTRIATTSGLTLTDGAGGYVPIIATGGTNYDVLTYVGGVIRLEPSAASGGTNIYSGDTPTTCEVGGMIVGTTLTGRTVSSILEEILVPTLDPVLMNPSLSAFIIDPSITLYEVGTVVTVTGTTCFNAGCIDPQYTAASDCRSDGVSGYCYSDFGACAYVISGIPIDVHCFSARTITLGNNTLSAKIHYSGGTQPKDSSGADYCTPLSACTTSTCSRIISGVYPWYWGIEASGGAAAGGNRPTGCCIKNVITGGTANKVVSTSTGTLNSTFNSTSDDYLWFATPSGSTSKTCWYVDALNSGLIGGAVNPGGNLFPDFESVTGITTTCWNNQEYKIYVSNYQSAATSNMQLRNS